MSAVPVYPQNASVEIIGQSNMTMAISGMVIEAPFIQHPPAIKAVVMLPSVSTAEASPQNPEHNID